MGQTIGYIRVSSDKQTVDNQRLAILDYCTLLVMYKAQMAIDRIKSRLSLLNKIISAFKEAEASGVKDPAKLVKRALRERSK